MKSNCSPRMGFFLVVAFLCHGFLSTPAAAQLMCPAENVMLECDESTDPSGPAGSPNISMACDNDTAVMFTDSITPGSCPQNFVITRTWTSDQDDFDGGFIMDLFNTGVDDNGNTVGDLILEVHYEVIEDINDNLRGASITTPLDGEFPIAPGGPWIANMLGPGGSRWIGPNATRSNGFGPNGNYTLRTTFTIPFGVDLTTVSVTGNWAMDDRGVDIEINEVSTGNFLGNPPNGNGFRAFGFFNITSFGFRYGENTLDFIIFNNENSATGLHVNDISGTFASCVQDQNSCVQMIQVDDTTPPSITCPGDVTIECDESSDPTSTGMPSFDDNCDDVGDIIITSVDSPNVTVSCPFDQTINRTWIATDQCGNLNTCEQMIQVVLNPSASPSVSPSTSVRPSTLPSETPSTSPSEAMDCEDSKEYCLGKGYLVHKDFGDHCLNWCVPKGFVKDEEKRGTTLFDLECGPCPDKEDKLS